jgi:formamidopyrimidine-DNA glycosylase
MPELPEVETIARDLNAALKGQKVTGARFRNVAIREDCNLFSPSRLVNKDLKEITRRGKNLIFHFSDDIAMVCHLKMTGRLIINDHSNGARKHLHFEMAFDNSKLSFFDVRKFGRICITDENRLKEHPRLSKLGPEPFEITSDEFVSVVKRRNKAIKLILLDQEIIAGLGNIYADEALYDAGIRPTSKPNRISKARLYKLHKLLSSFENYLSARVRQGNHPLMFPDY